MISGYLATRFSSFLLSFVMVVGEFEVAVPDNNI